MSSRTNQNLANFVPVNVQDLANFVSRSMFKTGSGGDCDRRGRRHMNDVGDEILEFD